MMRVAVLDASSIVPPAVLPALAYFVCFLRGWDNGFGAMQAATKKLHVAASLSIVDSLVGSTLVSIASFGSGKNRGSPGRQGDSILD
jgi:hypothetical protein